MRFADFLNKFACPPLKFGLAALVLQVFLLNLQLTENFANIFLTILTKLNSYFFSISQAFVDFKLIFTFAWSMLNKSPMSAHKCEGFYF